MADRRSGKRVISSKAAANSETPDPALRQLLEQARTDRIADDVAAASRLWVAGEEARGARPPAGLPALTGRVDVAQALRERGVECALSDYDFSPWPAASLDAVYYRISKEKALVHHVINQALSRLRPGGILCLAGYKQDGFKTYLDKAAASAGCEKSLWRGEGGVLLGRVQRGSLIPAPLPDQDYTALREVWLNEDLTLLSKPGIFGWDKVDAGSRLLINQLGQHGQDLWRAMPERVADLGCGYGYLSVMAARLWPQAEFTATDNNIGAVAACAANFERMAIRGNVIAADCGDVLVDASQPSQPSQPSRPFQAVLCNPPFHRGFDMAGDLGIRFLQRSRELLAGKGCAIFVVNQFLPIERLAAPLFSHVDELARNRSFKVLALRP